MTTTKFCIITAAKNSIGLKNTFRTRAKKVVNVAAKVLVEINA